MEHASLVLVACSSSNPKKWISPRSCGGLWQAAAQRARAEADARTQKLEDELLEMARPLREAQRAAAQQQAELEQMRAQLAAARSPPLKQPSPPHRSVTPALRSTLRDRTASCLIYGGAGRFNRPREWVDMSPRQALLGKSSEREAEQLQIKFPSPLFITSFCFGARRPWHRVTRARCSGYARTSGPCSCPPRQTKQTRSSRRGLLVLGEVVGPRGNTKGYSSTYLAMGFANIRAGTRPTG